LRRQQRRQQLRSVTRCKGGRECRRNGGHITSLEAEPLEPSRARPGGASSHSSLIWTRTR
jgi:hypothetical protein